MSVVVPQHVFAQQQKENVSIVNINKVPLPNFVNSLDYSDDFFEVLNRKGNKPDIVVFHGVYFSRYLKIAKELIRKEIPYVVVPHCSLTREALKQKWMKKLFANILFFNSFLKKSAAIHFLSENEKSGSLFSNKGFVCGNGVDLASSLSYRVSEKKLKFVYIGRLDVFHKGLDLLLDAIKIDKDFLLKSGFLLEIYGPKETYTHRKAVDAHDTLKRIIKKNGIDSLVNIHDAVFDEEKDAVLRSADVFIQTSRFEGLPMGVLEALAYGIPCIVTEGTNIANDVCRYNAGWTSANKVSGIAECIKEAFVHRNELNLASQSARKLIEDNFVWKKIADKEISIYRDIVMHKMEKGN